MTVDYGKKANYLVQCNECHDWMSLFFLSGYFIGH